MKRSLLIIIVSVILVSCIPVKYAMTPQVSGFVTDKEESRPISGASVYFKTYPENRATSDLQGKFLLEPVHEWIWVPLAPFDFVPHGDLRIEAPGYETLEEKNLGGNRKLKREFRLIRQTLMPDQEASLLKDREYLISECKRIATSGWGPKEAAELDNRKVDIYTEEEYVVVQFTTIPPEGFFVRAGKQTFILCGNLMGSTSSQKLFWGNEVRAGSITVFAQMLVHSQFYSELSRRACLSLAPLPVCIDVSP